MKKIVRKKRSGLMKGRLSIEEHQQAARDLKTIYALSSKLTLQFGCVGRRTVGPYGSLLKIRHFAAKARMRAAVLIRKEHPEESNKDIYGVWK